jgi:hypothetical protein
MLSCISNLVICNMELISYLLPWNLKEKGSSDLNTLVARSLLTRCTWRCACDEGCYRIKGIV